MKPLLLLFLLPFFFSCTSREKEIARLVKEWKNKEILFPDRLEAKIFGRDTVCPDLWKAKYKILNYIDTSGCTECRMHLYDWKKLKQQTDSLGLNVSYLFIAWIKQYDELETLQLINRCDIPFFYDRSGETTRLNHFPAQEGFQTFLLDSTNRVILIGNPVTNPTLYDLYLQTLQKHNKS